MKLLILATAALLSTNAFAVPVLINGSFETNTQSGQYADPWVFSGGFGWGVVSTNQPGWDAVASSGNYLAFLQNSTPVTTSISQTFISTEIDNYTFSFDHALRPIYNNSTHALTIALDGIQLGLYHPSLGWTSETVNAFNIGAGSHTLTFNGITTVAGDSSVLLDNVVMNAIPAVPEPSTAALLALGLSLIGLSTRRRSK